MTTYHERQDRRLTLLEMKSQLDPNWSPANAWLDTVNDDRDLEVLEAGLQVEEEGRDPDTLSPEEWARFNALIERCASWCRSQGW